MTKVFLSHLHTDHWGDLNSLWAGGAQAKIKQVDILDVAAEKISDRPLAFEIKSKWTAMGTVGHWGHIHTRKNLYDGIVTVKAVKGNWKITNLELLEEKHVDPYIHANGEQISLESGDWSL